MSKYGSTSKSPKVEGDVQPVTNFLLVKQMIEKDDLFFKGTFIQHIFNVKDEILKNEDLKSMYFQHKFNELTAGVGNEYIKLRRIEKNGSTLMQVCDVTLPMEIDVKFGGFPFQIATASVQIELSSKTLGAKNPIKPDLYLSKVRTDNLSIKLPLLKKNVKKEIKNHRDEVDNSEQENLIDKDNKSESYHGIPLEDLEESIMQKMDKSKSFDFVSPYPEIEYYYSDESKTCSKYAVRFYLVNDGIQHFFGVVMPMVVIATINTAAVLEDPHAEICDFIANAATLCLTAVFLLPSMVEESYRETICSINNLYILIIFVGLTLSSIPEHTIYNRQCSFIGMIVLWMSFLIPICNAILFSYHVCAIKKKLSWKNFISSDEKKHFNVKNHNYKERFLATRDIKDREEQKRDTFGYKSEGTGDVVKIKYN